MLLHTVNKSPESHSALRDCLQVIGDSDALLLLEDGVYGIATGSILSEQLPQLRARGISVYVLQEDLACRGLFASLPEGIEAIGYDTFVTLAAGHTATQSWY